MLDEARCHLLNASGLGHQAKLKLGGPFQQFADAIRVVNARKLNHNLAVVFALNGRLRHAVAVHPIPDDLHAARDGLVGLGFQPIHNLGVLRAARDVVGFAAEVAREPHVGIALFDCVDERADHRHVVFFRLLNGFLKRGVERGVAVAGELADELPGLHLQCDVHAAEQVKPEL